MGWAQTDYIQAQGQAQGWYRPIPVVAGPYTGPGDVVSGASAWWGLRGYNAAYSTGSNPAVDLVDQAGANPITINIKSDGTLDVAAISTWVAAHTVTTIKVTKLYDQAGTFHLIQATLALMPALVLGPVTGLASNRPALLLTAASSHTMASAGTLTVAQPMFMSLAANNAATGAQASFLFDNTNHVQGGYDNATANNYFIYSGLSVVKGTASDGSWHAIESTYDNASSEVLVDGTSSTGSLGNTVGFGGSVVLSTAIAGAQPYGGNIVETGIWPPAAATSFAANKATLSTNQHTYWGF